MTLDCLSCWRPGSAAGRKPVCPEGEGTRRIVTDIQESVVLIADGEETGRSFGTGFVIRTDAQYAWVVTCAHVLKAVGGPGNALVDGLAAEVVGGGDKSGFDAVVLRVDNAGGKLGKGALPLQASVAPASPFKIVGYYDYGGPRVRELVLGRLEKAIEVASPTGAAVTGWHLRLEGSDRLKPGY